MQWIQTGWLDPFPTWYWNPAATWSPATSSTFMAWLMLPPGNDVFARFVQAPVLPMLFLLTARLARLLGATRAVAGLLGMTAAMSRPFVSEAIIPKDDLNQVRRIYDTVEGREERLELNLYISGQDEDVEEAPA